MTTKGDNTKNDSESIQEPNNLQERLAELHALEHRYDALAAMIVKDFARAGRFTEAADLNRRLIATITDPERKARHIYNMGIIMENLGDIEAAASWYTEGISMEPTDRHVWYFLFNNVSRACIALGQYDRAEWYARQAREANESLYHAHRSLGISLAAQGRVDEALEPLIQAATICPKERSSISLVEELLHEHPDLACRFPDLSKRIEACKAAASEMLSSLPPARETLRRPQARGVDRNPWPNASGKRIAILDDEVAVIDIVGAQLVDAGFDVVGFEDKKEFMKQLPSMHVDLVVSDLMAPGMDGFELLATMRADHRWRRVPVIICSGYARSREREVCEKGAYACLTKPFDMENLMGLVREALNI